MNKDYDGTIFDDAKPLHNSPTPLPRISPIENAEAIWNEVQEWLDSDRATKATAKTLETAARLQWLCRSVVTHAANDGRTSPNGLTMKLTPASILELGYAWCQFRVQREGFERFAGIGIGKDVGSKPVIELTDEIRRLIDSPLGWMKLMKQLNQNGTRCTEAMAKRLCRERKKETLKK